MSGRYIDFVPRRTAAGQRPMEPATSGGEIVKVRSVKMKPVNEDKVMRVVTHTRQIEDHWEEELGVIEDLEPVEKKSSSTEVKVEEEKKEVEKKGKLGFIGGKSPFINTDKLEKRPLSAFRRAEKKPAAPVKDNYEVQAKKAAEESDVPTMMVTKASKGSSVSLVIVIIIVAILGAVAGFLAYLIFFQ